MREPARRVLPGDVAPTGTDELPAEAPTVAVVVSLNFPDMTDEISEIVVRFTKTALQTLVDVGVRVVLVDSSASPLPPARLVHEADGVLFLGGGDVDPALCGVTGPVRNLYGVDRAADEYCIDLIRTSVERDDPVLAICRGFQLLNFALGGTLIPDLEPWELHRGGLGMPLFLDENVTIAPGTKLRDILQRDRVTVRSGHHQALGTVATSLRIAASADDGIIEATEHVEASWVIGVQWHPEDTAGNATDRSRLIGAFVDHITAIRAARRARPQRSSTSVVAGVFRVDQAEPQGGGIHENDGAVWRGGPHAVAHKELSRVAQDDAPVGVEQGCIRRDPAQHGHDDRLDGPHLDVAPHHPGDVRPEVEREGQRHDVLVESAVVDVGSRDRPGAGLHRVIEPAQGLHVVERSRFRRQVEHDFAVRSGIAVAPPLDRSPARVDRSRGENDAGGRDKFMLRQEGQGDRLDLLQIRLDEVGATAPSLDQSRADA